MKVAVLFQDFNCFHYSTVPGGEVNASFLEIKLIVLRGHVLPIKLYGPAVNMGHHLVFGYNVPRSAEGGISSNNDKAAGKIAIGN
jgi:hypothetical protein